VTIPMPERSAPLSRLILRTGEYRAIGGTNHVVQGTDKPVEKSAFVITDLTVK
jgi:hypothetical protein